MPDYAKLAQQAEQETSKGGQDFSALAQQAEMEADAPAPLSGPVGAPPIPKALQDTPESNNRAALQSGLLGAAKSIPQTVADVGGAVSRIPYIGDKIAPRSEVNAFDKYSKADNADEEYGKLAGAAVQSVVPVDRALGLLPNAGRAGKTLSEIGAAAHDVPVNLVRTAQPLQRITELGARGNSIPKVADQLLGRSQAVAPMKFPEARDFYSSLARPSLWEKMTTSPPAKAALGDLKQAFHGDIGEAADTIGRGDDYSRAINEYRNAKRLQKVGATAGTGALGLGAKAAGAGAILGALKKFGVGE